jgi:hypothetical protein
MVFQCLDFLKLAMSEKPKFKGQYFLHAKMQLFENDFLGRHFVTRACLHF